MPVRKVVQIDEAKCDGCGQCVTSCAEGAIAIIDGKARLVGEVYCDGLGACLGHCPQGAISVEDREAEAYDAARVHEHLGRLAATKRKAAAPILAPMGGGHQCPGSMMRNLGAAHPAHASGGNGAAATPLASELTNWPVQLALVPPFAPYLQGADLLLAADCVPFAYADFHRTFLRGGKPVLIACPKLDNVGPYVQKLAQIFQMAEPKSLTILRMEVPCCGGLTRVAEQARELAQTDVPVREVVIGVQGEIQESAMGGIPVRMG
jgi:Pyruvate/2-oxoacid:ferredoxin oxidoreductase delta subunit